MRTLWKYNNREDTFKVWPLLYGGKYALREVCNYSRFMEKKEKRKEKKRPTDTDEYGNWIAKNKEWAYIEV